MSRWDDTFNAVAFVVVVFELTGSGVKVSAAVLMGIVPVLVFGFVAGTVIDRLPRRRVMIVADVGRAMIAALLPMKPDRLWALCAAVLVQPADQTRRPPQPLGGHTADHTVHIQRSRPEH